MIYEPMTLRRRPVWAYRRYAYRLDLFRKLIERCSCMFRILRPTARARIVTNLS